MIKIFKILVEGIVVLPLLLLLTFCSHDKTQLSLDDDASIVFIGNTFSEGFQRHNYFETLLYQNYPEKKLRVRNIGWSADEVNLMPRPLNFRSMEEQLSDLKADVIFMSYGLNESYGGEEKLEIFKSELETFLLDLKSKNFNVDSSTQFILLSPIPYEEINDNLPAGGLINSNLEMYAKAMNAIANKGSI